MDTKEILAEYAAASVKYREILAEPELVRSDFYERMAAVIDEHPSFLPAYIELLEQLESRKRWSEHQELLGALRPRIDSMLRVRFTDLEEILERFDFSGLYAVKKIGYWLLRSKRFQRNPFTTVKLKYLTEEADKRYASHPLAPSGTFLKCVERGIDVAPLQKMLEEHDQYWYIDIERQATLPIHRHTQAIRLRALVSDTEDEAFTSVDGDHESEITAAGKVFSEVCSFAETFARTRRAGLGRVVLARLAPLSMIYRHFDSEPCLRGRERYHLVIQNKGGDVLESGTDAARVREGEVWFFDNKVNHRVANDSNAWRTHLIFDMYPLDRATNAAR